MTGQKKGPNVWVVRHGTGYVVKLERGGRSANRGATQTAAVTYARSLARAYGSELVVQGRTGRIRIKDSHGRDPVSQKG
jgi:hypothetical protein